VRLLCLIAVTLFAGCEPVSPDAPTPDEPPVPGLPQRVDVDPYCMDESGRGRGATAPRSSSTWTPYPRMKTIQTTSSQWT